MGNLISDSPPFSDQKYDEFIKEAKFERCQVYSPQRHIFNYYSKGPETAPVIIFIPPMMCTPEIFYRQFFEFCYRGFRVISVHYSVVFNHDDWTNSFASFLDYVEVKKAHLVGCGLSGLLVQHFATHFPARVISLVLVNTYSDNNPYKMHRFEYAPMPTLILKDSLLTDELSKVNPDPEMIDCLQFLYNKFDQFTREEIISRYDLLARPLEITKPPIEPNDVTVITCLDITNIPEHLQAKLLNLYPGCHNALMKNGGDFPFFTRLDEFNLYLNVHLRRYHSWTPSINLSSSTPFTEKKVVTSTVEAKPPIDNSQSDNDKKSEPIVDEESEKMENNTIKHENVGFENDGLVEIKNSQGDEIFDV